MPHVTIQLIAGPSDEQLKKAAEEIRAVLQNTLGKPPQYTTVAVEEYDAVDWPDVFEDHIRDNPNLVIQPGYEP